MRQLKSLIGGAALAAGMLAGAGAYAADGSISTTINLSSGSNIYGHAFTAGNIGTTFSDKFYFTLADTASLSSGLAAFSFTATDNIDITGLSLVNSGGLSLAGTQVSSGALDTWSLGSNHLVADTYYLLVTGSVLSAEATSYGGGISVTAVPEPETYGMLLAGLGLVGFIARRSKKAAEAA